MKEKIESLTASQEMRFGEFVKKWTAIGLCTDPANREQAEQGISEMYQCGGIHPPRKIAWCGSPLSQGIARAIILDRKIPSAWSSAQGSVGHGVGNIIRSSVWNSVKNSVENGVWKGVESKVWKGVESKVWNGAGGIVRGIIGNSVGSSFKSGIWGSIYGQHDADWLGFYDYFYEVCGLVQETKKLSGLWKIAESAGWALPHENICWVSERHNVLKLDDKGRPHCLSGPAIAYPDGWEIYAVNGVRVPEYVVKYPQEISVEKIHETNNVEVRRVMVERYGPGRYLQDAGATAVHTDKYGTLYRVEQIGDEPLVMVKVTNSTPEPDGHFKDYWLRVPSDMTIAHEAVAWTFNLTAEEYQPVFES